MLHVHPIPAFDDNYIWAIFDSNDCVVVDPGDADEVVSFLQEKDLNLCYILITHHHYDHTGGVEKLKSLYPNVHVFGPNNPKIKGIDTHCSEGDSISLFNNELGLHVIEVPGHTLDHIAFYNDEWLFCGDTLFSAGCGRMFEGNPEMFWKSLSKLKSLDSKTKVYCTHEYTLANLNFALHLDAHNSELSDYKEWAVSQREKNLPTLPTDIQTQKLINPFMRCDDEEFVDTIQHRLDLGRKTEAEVFAACRRAKDQF